MSTSVKKEFYAGSGSITILEKNSDSTVVCIILSGN